MPTVQSSWLHQGFFVLGNERLMPSVRKGLERGLNLPAGTFRIAQFPMHKKWRHTCWWREGHLKYVEAQFFAQIAQDYPVLSLGVSIEKGYEGQADAAPEKQMDLDRGVWDWPRLTADAERLLSADIVAIAEALRQPIHIRIRSRKRPLSEEKVGWHSRAFSLIEGSWFERFVGPVGSDTIANAFRDLNGKQDSWGIVHFARDFSPTETEGLEASQLATTLIAFDGLRSCLRGAQAAHAGRRSSALTPGRHRA